MTKIKNRILITGASGCVGSSLVKKLAEDPLNDLTIFIPKNTWHPYLEGLKLKIIYGDIRNIKDVRKAMKNIDYVYQIAGYVSYYRITDQFTYDINYTGVKNILDTALEYKTKKIVVTASTAGVGIPENKKRPLTEKSGFNLSKYKKVMYMYSKHLCIELCKEYATKGVDVCCISPTTIYGQGDITMHVGHTIEKIINNKITAAPPGGNSVVSVDDVINAHILAMNKGKAGENYIVANEEMTYFDMYNRIAKLTGSNEITQVLPNWLLKPKKIFLELQEKLLLKFNIKPKEAPPKLDIGFQFRYFDSSKARRELGWKPKVTFEKAITKAVDFYIKYGLIGDKTCDIIPTSKPKLQYIPTMPW